MQVKTKTGNWENDLGNNVKLSCGLWICSNKEKLYKFTLEIVVKVLTNFLSWYFLYFPSRKYSLYRHFNLLRYSTFLFCYLFKLVFGAMFAVPHLVMAIKASEFYQHMPNEKISQGKLYIFTQQWIIELRYNSWLLTTFQCNLLNKIVWKNLKYGVFGVLVEAFMGREHLK